jgi:hypothetical protein
VSLDYFKADGKYADMFTKVYGDKPDRIQIIFISDDDNISCDELWEGREKATGDLAGKSDGETYELWDYDSQSGYIPTKDKKKVAEFSKQHSVEWSVILTLRFIIPAIPEVFGMWKLQTKGTKSSINSIINTYDSMKDHAGTVINIPFDLVVKKVKGQKPGQKRVYPVIDLVPNISSENIEILRKWLTQGGDIKDLGMVNDKKLNQLNANVKAIDQPEEQKKKDDKKKQPGSLF